MRIGVVLDSFESSYQETLVRWLEVACRDNGFRLVVMAGGGLGANHHAAPLRNSIYDWVAPRSALDGLVLLGGTLVRERALVQRWCDRLRPMPMCSIGLELDGVPSVLTDNESGIRAMVRHLVTDHGLQRLAFVSGPAGNQEARERLFAFRSELTVLGLNGDGAPHAEGDFRAPSGRAATSLLLGKYPNQLDGIMAANDYMAMGILEVLSASSGSYKPRVAVTGFDDINEAAFTVPPLTTVQQPMRRLAAVAVESVLAQLAGEPCEPVVRLAAQPRLRRSCGCKEMVQLGTARARTSPRRDSFDMTLRQRSSAIEAELQRISDGLFTGMSGWAGQLVDGFIEQARGVPGDLFLNAVDRMVLTLTERQSEVWRFHAVLTALRAMALDAMAGNAMARLDAEEMFHAAREMTGAGAMRAEARRHGDAQERHRLLNSMATRLFACTDASSVRAALDDTLPAFNLQQAFIMTLVPPAADGTPQARLWYSLDVNRDGQDNQPFLAHELLPAAVWERLRCTTGPANWIVLPLFSQRAVLGFAVLALVHHTGAAYETLRVNLSAALVSAGVGARGEVA